MFYRGMSVHLHFSQYISTYIYSSGGAFTKVDSMHIMFPYDCLCLCEVIVQLSRWHSLSVGPSKG